MPHTGRIAFALSCLTALALAQTDVGFSGVWKLNPERSEIRSLPTPPAPYLKVEQDGSSLRISSSRQEGGPAQVTVYPLDGKELKTPLNDSTCKTVTKWEGDALLVNTIVSGPSNYSIMERWTRSRDGNTLTIKRTLAGASGESESLLRYENPAVTPSKAASAPPSKGWARRPPAEPSTADVVIPAGTHILLQLSNPLNTKVAAAGDRVYLETAYPVFIQRHLVIPKGSYVAGTVSQSQRAGRVKGKAALALLFDTITLPNGVSRDLRSRPGSVDDKGDVSRSEGKIQGDGNKAGDARTVGGTTAAGATIGGLAGGGMGAGVGAAAGAAAGLAGVFSRRGPEVVLPKGTSLELVLDRDLHYNTTELMRGN